MPDKPKINFSPNIPKNTVDTLFLAIAATRTVSEKLNHYVMTGDQDSLLAAGEGLVVLNALNTKQPIKDIIVAASRHIPLLPDSEREELKKRLAANQHGMPA